MRLHHWARRIQIDEDVRPQIRKILAEVEKVDFDLWKKMVGTEWHVKSSLLTDLWEWVGLATAPTQGAVTGRTNHFADSPISLLRMRPPEVAIYFDAINKLFPPPLRFEQAVITLVHEFYHVLNPQADEVEAYKAGRAFALRAGWIDSARMVERAMNHVLDPRTGQYHPQYEREGVKIMCIMEVRPGQHSATMTEACAHNTQTVISDIEMFAKILEHRDPAKLPQLRQAQTRLRQGFEGLLDLFGEFVAEHDHLDHEGDGTEREAQDVREIATRQAKLARRYMTR
jgi:hypothetical protein